MPIYRCLYGSTAEGVHSCPHRLGNQSNAEHRYIEGAASSFSGQDIIKESGYGVVTVIIQYRLGVFGFLPGSEVLANGTLNAGLRECTFSDDLSVYSLIGSPIYS